MTNTDLPQDPIDPEVLAAIRDGLEARNRDQPITDRLTESNRRSLVNLRDSLISFVTPMTRLQSSIGRMDETNRKVLMSAGTTYGKLEKSLRKNSDVLDQNLVSNRALITEIASNFGQGIRINNGALTDLTQEMIATGQNTALQRKMNADQVLQTGNNTRAVQSINKTNKDVSDKYGVSNDRLIESLNSLKGVMDQASFFGPQAVTSFKNIATELKGRAGGANIEGGLDALFKVLGPGSEGLAASRLLGAGGLRQTIAGGGAISTEDLAPIFANLERIIGSSKGEFGAEIAGARMGLGKAQMVQLMQLNNIMKSNFELDKDDKASQDEKFNTLKNLRDKQNDWYDHGAGVMLGHLGAIDSSMLFLIGSLAQGGGIAGTLFGGAGKAGKGKPQAGIGALTKASKGSRLAGGLKGAGVGLGVGMGINAIGGAMGVDTSKTAMLAGMGAVAGPWGMLIGGIAGGVWDIVNYTSQSAEADKERVKQEKEKADSERAAENSKDIQRLKFLTGYFRSRSNAKLWEDDDVKESLRGLVAFAQKAENRAGQPGRTTAGTGGK